MKALETSRKATMQSNRERLIKMAARISSMLGPVKPPPQTVTVKGLAPPPSPTATGGVPSAAPVKTQGFRTTSPAVEMAGIPKVPTTPAMPTTPSTAATPAMPKVAAAKWRELVRSGQASDAVKKGLHEMGLLGTPEAISREIRGIHSGTRLLSRRHGIKHEKWTPWRGDPRKIGGAAETILHPLRPVPDKLADPEGRVVRANERLRKILSARIDAAYASDPGSFAANRQVNEVQKRWDAYRKKAPYIFDVVDRVQKRLDDGLSAGTIKWQPVHGPMKLDKKILVAPGKKDLKGRADNALTRRHELDEHLLDTSGGLGRAIFASHVSPEVIAREAGHANFLHPFKPGGLTPHKSRRRELAAISNVQKGIPSRDVPVPPGEGNYFNLAQGPSAVGMGPKRAEKAYRKFYGDYYGMSKKKRVKFDEAAAAQFGYLPYGKTPPATSQYQR